MVEIYSKILEFDTNGEITIVDLSSMFEDFIKKTGVKEGILSANVIGSTAALTTIEYERRVLDDFKEILKTLIPKGAGYKHDVIDNNAHSHLRASLIGPSLSLSIKNGSLQVGTWQQPVFVCLDVRPRHRRVALTIIGK